jgi:hypothetical protein
MPFQPGEHRQPSEFPSNRFDGFSRNPTTKTVETVARDLSVVLSPG